MNKRRLIGQIEGELKTLETEMKRIHEMPNKVEAIVSLFKVISPLQDKGGFAPVIARAKKGRRNMNGVLKNLEVLQNHIQKAGRSEYGINRTKPGEEVTSKKVFLGNVFGVWTRPASFWLENQERFGEEDSGATPKEGSGKKYISVWYCINDYQARNFVDFHTMGILQAINNLKILTLN